MTEAVVVPINDEDGPPRTDYEREAVTAFLQHIRAFQAENGVDPNFTVFVSLNGAKTRLGWRAMGLGELMAAHFALAGALMTEEALSKG